MGKREAAEDYLRRRLRAEREQRHWTLAQVAKALEAKGTGKQHTTTIAKIEAGDRAVRIDELIAFSAIFDLPVDTLLGRQTSHDREVAKVLRSWQDTTQSALGDVRTHLYALGDRAEDLMAIEGGDVESAILRPGNRDRLLTAAQRAVRGLSEAHDALSEVAMLVIPLMGPIQPIHTGGTDDEA